MSYSEGIADVAVLDDNYSIIGEVGNTPPKKMVRWVGGNQDAVFLHVPYGGVDREVSSKSPSTEVNSALTVEGRDAIAEYTYTIEILAFVEQQAKLRENLRIS